ncbi:LexA family protein [Corticimicrobacter populi]|uniref:HTH cro/C1-type domain-containing protein n=1 Tax=Corticimicrobacter populi TaxID=2175229 RepID=A0A2V1K7T7_9BURK|nr:S24 family peptidase [Corticimicrobacter populi]PWF25032.1 hypothetical protein DD235_02360 [Corticimicrobacter populi]
MKSSKPIGSRLRQRRTELGLSQQALASASGVSQGLIGQIESGINKGTKHILQIAAALQVAPEWLLSGGDDPPYISESDQNANSNVSAGPDLRGNVPLISSVQAGAWTEIAHTFRPSDAELWLPCPVKHGPRTFCLRVEGESMKNPGSKPSYDPGDIIFVDPDVCASPGSRVVVKLDDQDKATFKQYMEEDGRKLLKALNPDWKPRYIEINGNATICGVVIGKWVEE